MEVELRAERMAAGGDAIAREASGRIVFVTGALPGELVRATMTAEKRDYAKSVVTEVVEPSPHRRRAAVCERRSWLRWVRLATHHAGGSARAEAGHRRRRAAPHRPPAQRRGGARPSAATRAVPHVPSPRRGTGRSLGYRRVQSHDVVTVDDCLVAHPLLAPLIADVRLPGAAEAVLRCADRTGERSLAWSAGDVGEFVPPGYRPTCAAAGSRRHRDRGGSRAARLRPLVHAELAAGGRGAGLGGRRLRRIDHRSNPPAGRRRLRRRGSLRRDGGGRCGRDRARRGLVERRAPTPVTISATAGRRSSNRPSSGGRRCRPIS